ncbi:gastrula zinc finger protein XlCGF58.1-like [Planococcus citri]|uniref:gastrula zinc finger protein XlCGF58.1-like n=1 Tax=Planococcus citri TaxID=170843 RepID=UPI0031F7C44A
MSTTRKFVCSWSDCGSLFTRKDALSRHIKTVHKNQRDYVCDRPKCGHTYTTSYHLKRHILCAHQKERSFICDQCHKAFAVSQALRRHEREVHGTKIITSDNTTRIEKLSYECAECGFNFVRKANLVKHLADIHGNNERFECHTCGCKYSKKQTLIKHIIETHQDPVRCTSKKKSWLYCIICNKLFQHRPQIEKHYQEFHRINFETEKHTFSCKEDFLSWKQNVENCTTTRFHLMRKSKWKLVYVCHRSGRKIIKSSNRKRAYIVRGSKKLDGVCPASITLHLNRKYSSCVATFLKTHVGHQSNDETELKYCFLRPEEREKLAGMLVSGIPKREILNDQLRDSTNLPHDFNPTNVAKTRLLTNKDLCNVETTFNVKTNRTNENSIRLYNKDSENVEEFVKEDHCVEMYTVRIKPQTCPAEEDPDIGACYLICDEDGDNAHRYSCSCSENATKSHMCEHIHTVLSNVQVQEPALCEPLSILNEIEPPPRSTEDVQDYNSLVESAACEEVERLRSKIQMWCQRTLEMSKSYNLQELRIIDRYTRNLDAALRRLRQKKYHLATPNSCYVSNK